MTHQSRMLLIIALLSVGGVSALMYMAHRYASVLEQQAAAPQQAAPSDSGRQSSVPAREPAWKRAAAARALARVDEFIDVRSRIRAEIDRRGGAMPDQAEFLTVRSGALTATGMGLADYGDMRDLFRSWRRGRLDRSSLMSAAFEERRTELEPLDLGEHESLDS